MIEKPTDKPKISPKTMKAAEEEPNVESFFPEGTMRKTAEKWIEPYLYTAPEAMHPAEQRIYTLGCYVVRLTTNLTAKEDALGKLVEAVKVARAYVSASTQVSDAGERHKHTTLKEIDIALANAKAALEDK